MFKHYIKTAFANIWQNKAVAGINILSLSTGLCVCFFILLFVRFELSYDTYNKNADDIYRLVTDVKTPGGIDYRGTSAPMGPAIQAAFPEVKASTRILLDYLLVQRDEKNFSEEKIAYADSSLFSIFTLPLVSGNYKTVFNAPFNIVISQTAAKKYFGNEDPMGKVLIVDGKQPAVITGIMKDMPYNSHFRVDMFFSMPTLLKVYNPARATNWGLFGFNTYLLLPNNDDVNKLTAKLPAFIKSHIEKSLYYTLLLEPLRSVYLHGKPRGWRTGSAVTGSIANIYIFILAAVLVLFTACVNYINLSTAFSLKRAKEIGVRKVMGAKKGQLVTEFLTNSLVISVLAFTAAILLCMLLLPVFDNLFDQPVSTGVFSDMPAVMLLLTASIASGLVAGIYPAFFLSSLRPVTVLKGGFATKLKGAALRKALVTFQFAISIILIVSTIVVHAQVQYMQNTQLGFTKDHKLAIDFHFDYRVWQPAETVKQQLTAIPGVVSASFSSCIPGRANIKLPVTIENKQGTDQQEEFDAYFFDADFLQQYQIAVVAGRGFSTTIASDSTEAMLVNEAAAKSLGYTNAAEAVGRRFSQEGNNGRIIGVIKDFHFHSMREEVQPLTVRIAPWRHTFLTLGISSQNLPATINVLEKKWQQLAPGLPFNYFFTNEAFDAQYKAEDRFGKLFICFAISAMLISSLGLLALSYFTIVQRTKELGIRKVLGAPVGSIAALLSKDFLTPVFISFVAAVPVSWLAMQAWLQNYAYRVTISWWMFLLAGVIVLCISAATICSHTIKAATANPVKNLKVE